MYFESSQFWSPLLWIFLKRQNSRSYFLKWDTARIGLCANYWRTPLELCRKGRWAALQRFLSQPALRPQTWVRTPSLCSLWSIILSPLSFRALFLKRGGKIVLHNGCANQPYCNHFTTWMNINSPVPWSLAVLGKPGQLVTPPWLLVLPLHLWLDLVYVIYSQPQFLQLLKRGNNNPTSSCCCEK